MNLMQVKKQTLWFDSQRTIALSFNLGVPLLLGLLFALAQSGTEPLTGIPGHFLYWTVSTVLSWQMLSLGTAITATLLKHTKPPFITVLLLGFILGIVLWVPVSTVRDVLVSGVVQDGQSLQSTARYSNILVSLCNWLLGIILWVASNYIYLYFLGYKRFGYSPDPDASKRLMHWFFPAAKQFQPSEVKAPVLYKRLTNRGQVLALCAEDHYTRIILPDCEELVYIRFKDAIAEMSGQQGLQTHRSYWVSTDAVINYSEQSQSAAVELLTGAHIPVSRSYRTIVKHTFTNGTLAKC